MEKKAHSHSRRGARAECEDPDSVDPPHRARATRGPPRSCVRFVVFVRRVRSCPGLRFCDHPGARTEPGASSRKSTFSGGLPGAARRAARRCKSCGFLGGKSGQADISHKTVKVGFCRIWRKVKSTPNPLTAAVRGARVCPQSPVPLALPSTVACGKRPSSVRGINKKTVE